MEKREPGSNKQELVFKFGPTGSGNGAKIGDVLESKGPPTKLFILSIKFSKIWYESLLMKNMTIKQKTDSLLIHYL